VRGIGQQLNISVFCCVYQPLVINSFHTLFASETTLGSSSTDYRLFIASSSGDTLFGTSPATDVGGWTGATYSSPSAGTPVVFCASLIPTSPTTGLKIMRVNGTEVRRLFYGAKNPVQSSLRIGNSVGGLAPFNGIISDLYICSNAPSGETQYLRMVEQYFAKLNRISLQ
jgi:hypothetical protein